MIRNTSSLSDALKRTEDKLARIEADLLQIGGVQRSARIGARAATLFGLLQPRDLVGARYVRLGRDHDGGYVMVDNALNGGVAYSLGISDDVSWDQAMAERGYHVFQYDHTIDALPLQHPNFAFHKTGICGYGKDDAVYRSLDSLVTENGHAGRADLVLKIDIEGAEWDVFSTVLDSTLLNFSQIVVELHWFDRADDDIYFGNAYAALKRLSTHFIPVHIHANNHGALCWFGDTAVPQLLEVTLLRKGLFQDADCSRTFPTPIDQPNRMGWDDIYLGKFSVGELKRPSGVTRDEIRRAYRLILNRDPESEMAYAAHAVQPNYDSLLWVLLNSPEYRNRIASK